jgi:subtilisin family serine protease
MLPVLLAAAISTMCQAADVPVMKDVTDRRLIGCGAGFADNLLWHLDRSDSVDGTLDGAFDRSTTGRGAVIYVLDTGIRRDHEEFLRPAGSTVIAGFEIAGWELWAPPGCADPALEPCWETWPQLGTMTHGSAVASIAGGRITGVAPDATLVSLRVTGPEENWIRALERVIAHAFAPDAPPFRTAIVNISGGVKDRGTAPEFEALARRMIDGVNANGESDPNGKRFLFVVAAGNSAQIPKPVADNGQCSRADEVQIVPANLGPSIDGLVTVGGLSKSNALWAGSCKGPLLEVLAPAEEVLVASISDRDAYRWKPEVMISGTSYATPYVSGMAARMLELDPSLTPAELERRLKASPSRASGLPVPVAPARPKRRSVR